jgi:hypothetical protein
MDSIRKLEVTTWHGQPGGTVSAVPRSLNRHLVSPRLLGLAGTILLHILVLQSFLLGTRAIRVPTLLTHGRRDSNSFIADAESGLILVEVTPVEPLGSKGTMFNEFIGSGPQSKDVFMALLKPDPPSVLNLPGAPVDRNQELESPDTTGDSGARERLFGIYSKQIEARVERVWRRPRTPVTSNPDRRSGTGGDEAFRCQVRIVQDAMGNVQEILLPQCNGSAAWQHSLITAIRQASPLPAPPSPTVFTNTLTLTFTGLEYTRDSSVDDYEIGATGRQ